MSAPRSPPRGRRARSRRSPHGRRHRRRRNRTPGETRSPGSTESSTASSSRSTPRRLVPRAPGFWMPARHHSRDRAGTPHRSTARRDLRTRPRPPPGPSGSGCTSERASCPCRPGRVRRTFQGPERSPPDSGSPSSGNDDPSPRTRTAAGTLRSSRR